MATKRKKKPNPMGRPTKYSKAILVKANKYIDGGYQETSLNEVIPIMAGLALYLNVNKSTLYEWVKNGKNPDFSNTLSKLQDYQEVKVLNRSLDGDFNPQIAKLMLANHGYHEKQKEDDNTQNEELADALKKILEAVPN